jgi:phenylalanyl-tRNA synthetase alpha chain
MEAARGRVPLRVIAPGRTFRRDNDDATHASSFHQVEGLAIDEGLSLADLKGTLALFARALFGAGTRVRLRPSYFPFTEPSAELDITCVSCGGAGCRLCKGTGFIEILGAGMVHPRVLEAGGYDPERVSGFAFGMGIERVAILRYGIADMRLLQSGDLTFLSAFPAVDREGVAWA